MDGTTLQCVIYREGDAFVAQCLNADVASEGATPEEARAHLAEALELYLSEPHPGELVTTISDAHVDQVTLKSA